MDFEWLWYEFSPYLYTVVGSLAAFSDSSIGSFSGVLLLAASGTVMRLRWVYRRKEDSKVKRAINVRH